MQIHRGSQVSVVTPEAELDGSSAVPAQSCRNTVTGENNTSHSMKAQADAYHTCNCCNFASQGYQWSSSPKPRCLQAIIQPELLRLSITTRQAYNMQSEIQLVYAPVPKQMSTARAMLLHLIECF